MTITCSVGLFFLWRTISILAHVYMGFQSSHKGSLSSFISLTFPTSSCTEVHINDGLADPCPRGSRTLKDTPMCVWSVLSKKATKNINEKENWLQRQNLPYQTGLDKPSLERALCFGWLKCSVYRISKQGQNGLAIRPSNFFLWKGWRGLKISQDQTLG